MATELQTDKLPHLPVPDDFEDQVELIRFLRKQRDYQVALRKDLAKLRDLYDTQHP